MFKTYVLSSTEDGFKNLLIVHQADEITEKTCIEFATQWDGAKIQEGVQSRHKMMLSASELENLYNVLGSVTNESL